jgi:recombination protein RecT
MSEIKELSPWDKFTNQIADQKEAFHDLLPQNCSYDKFISIIKSAVYKTPALLNADRTSFINACRFAAQDGLIPDGREAALVIYSRKQKGGGYIEAVQYMPMVAGILKKVRNSGELLSLSANVVYSNDEFDYCLGDDEYIKHKPAMSNRGDIVCCYAIVKTKDGAIYREVMNKQEVDEVKKSSKGGDFSPWSTHYSEMMKKTVIRRLSKRLPMSTDLESSIKADDNMYDFNHQLENMPAPKPSALDFLNSQLEDGQLKDKIYPCFIDLGDAKEIKEEELA